MRAPNEASFRTHDDVALFYRHWPAVTGQPDQASPSTHSSAARRAIVLFHRGHEHSARMAHLVDELDLPQFEFFAWDARGHGRSPGERGYSPSFATSVRDVQTFIDHIALTHGIAGENIAVVAQSVGAVLVATWMHDYAPPIRCAVLASPAFKVKLYVPFARTGLALLHKLRGKFFVNSYVKAKFLTHDPTRIASYESDPLITRPIAVNVLLGLYEAAERVVADAQAITTPTQLLISGSDWVVHQGPQQAFFERLGSPVKEQHVLPGFYHDTLGERDRADAIAKARAFITARFAAPNQSVDLRSAHLHGFTKSESDTLSRPLSPLSPRGAYWALTRALLKFGGLLSSGVGLGHETGFDSGSTLDYVYRNRPEGITVLGRAIDANYLNAIGWRGIRQRKLHIEELLREAMHRVHATGHAVHVLDIAAGHGRYVLEALTSSAQMPASILLRDYSDINVRDGRALIAEKGLDRIARFEKADAFDGAGIATVSPKPTIAIVSGLYELFADNAMIERSLAGLSQAVPIGGYLIYTNQPWHPQLELIARALTSHRAGAAWVMRRRTQREMDQLVEHAGFGKIAQRIDEWGIFTVSLAVRDH